MKVALFTREYPPEVYGGAGVHVEYLARELARLEDVVVHCWGAERPSDWRPPVVAHDAWDALAGDRPELASLRAFSIDLTMAAAAAGADVVHSHTWYANLAGHLAGLTYDVPHVVSTHSLEPQRPWKAEQLGGGYRISSFAERESYEGAAGVIAVSAGMRADILKAYPAVHLKIGGYTDNVGDEAANLALSQARAASVVNELVSMGIAADRLEAKGYGEEHPVATNGTEEGREQNRRVAFQVTAH